MVTFLGLKNQPPFLGARCMYIFKEHEICFIFIFTLHFQLHMMNNELLLLQGESKKMSVKEMFDFLTLKMLPLALALIKTKNRHLFDPLVKNCPFSMEISL